MSEARGGGGAPQPEIVTGNGAAPDQAHTPQALAESARVVADEEAAALARAEEKLRQDRDRAKAVVESGKASVAQHKQLAQDAAAEAERLAALAREEGG